MRFLPFACTLLFMLSTLFCAAQTDEKKNDTVIVKGVCRDFVTREAIPFAGIYLVSGSDMQLCAWTDLDGKFSFPSPPGKHAIKISYPGYPVRMSFITVAQNMPAVEVLMHQEHLLPVIEIVSYREPLIDPDRVMRKKRKAEKKLPRFSPSYHWYKPQEIKISDSTFAKLFRSNFRTEAALDYYYFKDQKGQELAQYRRKGKNFEKISGDGPGSLRVLDETEDSLRLRFYCAGRKCATVSYKRVKQFYQ